MILAKSDAGQDCPNAADMCTAEVLDTLLQCLCLPGEISPIVRQYLYLQCTANGCYSLNQRQQLIRVRGSVDSPLDLFLPRLNSKGQRTIQAALGTCPPQQRMWGISGTVFLGVHLATEADQHVVILNRIRDMPASEDIVHIEGEPTGEPTGVTLSQCGSVDRAKLATLSITGARLTIHSAAYPSRHSSPQASTWQPAQMTCWLFRNGIWLARA